MKVFTVKQIQALKPKKEKFYVWEATGRRNIGSLGVCVYPSGTKTYLYRYSKGKVRRRIKLGQTHLVSLVDARTKVQEYSYKVSIGEDPLPQCNKIEASQASGTIEDMFSYYIEKMKADGKRSYNEVISAVERDVYVEIDKSIAANEVTSRQIAEILAKMIQRGAATGSNRLRSYLHAAFNTAIKHDNDPANLHNQMRFGLTQNPVTPVPRQNVEKVGERALSENELATLLKDIQATGFSPLTKFAILLCLYGGGQRPYEVINTRYSWIDIQAKTWTIPGTITKNKLELVIPMSKQLTALIEESRLFAWNSPFLICKRLDPGQPMHTSSIAQVLQRYCKRKGIEPFVPRDLRRTCKTLMTKHGIGTMETRNRLHNHALNDVSNKHYNKYDYFNEKLEIVCEWGNYLDSLVEKRV
ncbi:MAG: tyrosine-type recombinase/integrase [Idiomarina sp.]|nr:tyrosine-type recombinase/integrase [Idiomarina sp.]